MYYPFASNLRYYREKKDMTKTKLAELLNVSTVTIWKWENCEAYPSIDRVIDIARALGIDARLLLDPDNVWV